MTARVGLVRPLRIRALALAVSLTALAACGCKHAPPSASAALLPSSESSPGVLVADGRPVGGPLTLERIRGLQVLEVDAHGRTTYRMRIDRGELDKVAYYGMAAYPNAAGARIEAVPDTESASALDPFVATLVTTDAPTSVAEWYATHLSGWSRGRLGNSGVVFSQQPHGRRRICLTPLPDTGLLMIGYQVLDDSDPTPVPFTEQAARKWEHVFTINLAADQYRRDTGKKAGSIADLTAKSGPPGYRGPYLARGLTDPYTGKPYQLGGGVVVGPGDVRYGGS